MRLEQLTKRVYCSTFDRNRDWSALGVVCGNNFNVMIDAGASPKQVQAFYQLLKDNAIKQPELTILTHWHWDHSFGMSGLAGRTIACRETHERLLEMATWQWNDAAMAERLADGREIPFADTNIRKEYPDTTLIALKGADIVFERQLEIALGDLSVVLKKVVSPHCTDSVLVHIPTEGVVFAGDAIGVDYYNNGYLDSQKLQTLLETMTRLDFAYCVLGHIEPMNKKQTLQLMEQLLNRGL